MMALSSSDGTEPRGRERQRRRTRRAILSAAMELMAAGETPAVARVAERADVSRRTVYLYFPTQEQLAIDAALGLLSQDDVEAAIERAGEPEERAAALARALADVRPDVERAGRMLIGLTVGGADGAPCRRRGYRRVEWIELALEPLRARLGAAPFERLVTALAMVAGFEAMVVQRDLRGLSPAAGADVSEWAARALVRAAIAEASER